MSYIIYNVIYVYKCERGHSIVLHCKVKILCSPTEPKPRTLIPNTQNLPRKHKNYLVFCAE